MTKRPPRRCIRLAGATLALAVLAAAVASVASIAAEPRPAGHGDPLTSLSAGAVEYGVAEPATDLPGTFSQQDFAAWNQIRNDVAGSGGCWLRSDLNEWLTRAIETLPWLGSSTGCGAASGAPVKVLAILDDQTVWAAQRVCPDTAFSVAYERHHADFTLDDWRALVGCIATRYRGRISAYEIWNEPVLSVSMFGLEDGSAAHYADLLRVAYVAIKSADPSAIVIALGGSDLYAKGDPSRLPQMHEFTQQLVALGARRYADAISLHAYPWGRDDAAVWSSYLAELRFEEQEWQRPVWITETGTRTTDPGTQSAYAVAAYTLFVQAGVDHVFWFADTDQPDGTFGLRGRPVESALRAFAQSHP